MSCLTDTRPSGRETNCMMARLFPRYELPQFRESAAKTWEQMDSGTEGSVQFSHSFVSNSLRPHGLQHTRPPCPSPDPGACSSSCLSSGGCHPTISSSVIPFSCLQSFPASESFPTSQIFASGGQNIGASALASVLPINIQG